MNSDDDKNFPAMLVPLWFQIFFSVIFASLFSKWLIHGSITLEDSFMLSLIVLISGLIGFANVRVQVRPKIKVTQWFGVKEYLITAVSIVIVEGIMPQLLILD